MKRINSIYIVLGIILSQSICCYASENMDENNIPIYERKSVTVLAVNHGDKYDKIINDAVYRYLESNNKFDINDIGFISLNGRGVDQVASTHSSQIGHSIMSFWFHRQADGTMDDSLILSRGRYNANDQTYNIGQATAIGNSFIENEGFTLLKNSYVAIVEYKSSEMSRNVSGVTVEIAIYSLQWEINDFYKKCWIYENDTESVRMMKCKSFDSFPVRLIKEHSGNYSFYMRGGILMSSEEHDSRCIQHCLLEALGGKDGIECITARNNNDSNALNEAISGTIYSNFPLRVKMGVKEDIKPVERFRVYKYKEDKNGNLKKVPTGHIRAANVKDNRNVATGYSAASAFYRIAGSTKAGSTIVREKPKTWSYSVGVTFNYLGQGVDLKQNLDFTNWQLNFNARKLLRVSSFGMMQYLLLDGILDVQDLDEGLYLSAGAGYGLGIRPIQFLELMPFVKFGVDVEDGNFYPFMRPGARLSCNIIYPFGFYVQGENYNLFGQQNDWLISAGVHLWF